MSVTKRLTAFVFCFSAIACWAHAFAQGYPDATMSMISYAPLAPQAATLKTAQWSAKLNARLLSLPIGEHFFISMPGSDGKSASGNRIELVRRGLQPSGEDIAILATPPDSMSGEQLLLTISRNGAFSGRLDTPQESWSFTPYEDHAKVFSLANLQPMSLVDDAVPVVPPSEAFLRHEQTWAPKAETQQQGPVTINLLVLFSSNLRALYPAKPGAMDVDGAVKTRLQYLVDYANTAHQNSGSMARLHIAGLHPILFFQNTKLEKGLNALRKHKGVFKPVGWWRERAHADLVVWVQDYREAKGSCGLGAMPLVPVGRAIGQYDLLGLIKQVDASYSVVYDGHAGNYYCTDDTLAHETGHNMGLDHDRAHTSPVPAGYQLLTPFGYGYGIAGVFGDVMSYLDPKVPYFSTPLKECAPGQPCGIADQADCVRAINLVAGAVAGLR